MPSVGRRPILKRHDEFNRRPKRREGFHHLHSPPSFYSWILSPICRLQNIEDDTFLIIVAEDQMQPFLANIMLWCCEQNSWKWKYRKNIRSVLDTLYIERNIFKTGVLSRNICVKGKNIKKTNLNQNLDRQSICGFAKEH